MTNSTTQQRIQELRDDLRRLTSQVAYDQSIRGDIAYLRAEIKALESKQQKHQ